MFANKIKINIECYNVDYWNKIQVVKGIAIYKNVRYTYRFRIDAETYEDYVKENKIIEK